MSKELLIKGGHVVTVDPRLGDLAAGDVLVTDGAITAVGKDLKPATAEAEVIDTAGRLVVPGMVDTHRHVWQGAIGGYTPQITGVGYGHAVLTGISLQHTPEDVYAGTLWGALQALDAGITTIADWAHNNQSPAHADADLRGLRDSGIRGYFLYGGPGRPPATPTRPTRQTPAACAMSTSAPVVTAASAWAWRCVAGVHQRRAQHRRLRVRPRPGAADLRPRRIAGTGQAVTVLDRHSLLGADINYVHGNFLTDREWDLIAESGGTMTITPTTDMLMQFGTFPATGPALNRGIVSGFGIDTICSASNDLFSEMRLALAAERSRANATAISSDKMAPARRPAPAGHVPPRHHRRRPGLAPRERNRHAHPRQAGRHRDHRHSLPAPGRLRRSGRRHGPRRRTRRCGNRHRRRQRRQARGQLTGDHATKALELMHATRRHLHA